MYTGIQINNFKNLNVDLTNLKKINLIIGPNNSGKTNLLNCLSFMKDVVSDSSSKNSFSNVINSLGGYQTVNRDTNSNLVSFKFDIKKSGHNVLKKNLTTYEIEYEYTEADAMPKITKELYYYTEKFSSDYTAPFYIFNCHTKIPGSGLFTYFEERSRRAPIKVSLNESAINQITRIGSILNDLKLKNGIDRVIELMNFFNNSHFFSMAKFTNNLQNNYIQKNKLNLGKLKNDGSNFIDCMYRICVIEDGKEKNKKILENLLSDIFYVNKVEIDFLDKEEIIALQFKIFSVEKDEIKRIDELSDGTMKLLYMALMLIDNQFSEDNSGILAIDEPETSLHPAWIDVFGKWILNNDFGKQIFISTHSPELLDVFTKGFSSEQVGIIIMQPNGYVENLDYELVKEAIENNYGLGDLYRADSEFIGGWPWEK